MAGELLPLGDRCQQQQRAQQVPLARLVQRPPGSEPTHAQAQHRIEAQACREFGLAAAHRQKFQRLGDNAGGAEASGKLRML